MRAHPVSFGIQKAIFLMICSLNICWYSNRESKTNKNQMLKLTQLCLSRKESDISFSDKMKGGDQLHMKSGWRSKFEEDPWGPMIRKKVVSEKVNQAEEKVYALAGKIELYCHWGCQFKQ